MARHHHSIGGSRLSALVASILIGVAVVPAQAETGTANAGDVQVHINLLGIATLDVDPQVPVGFNNEVDATFQQDSLPSLDTGGTLLHLSTGALNSDAQYAPGVAISVVGADVDIANLDLSAVSVLGSSLLSLSADAIHTSSLVSGYCLPAGRRSRRAVDEIMFFNGFDVGNLMPGGDGSPGDDVILQGMGLSVMGTPVPNIPSNPAPNTSIDLSALGIAGATLILNEQTIGGDGVDMSSVSTNAVHLNLNVAGLITADVVIGHSDSELDCTQ
jgi:hypothetical protein